MESELRNPGHHLLSRRFGSHKGMVIWTLLLFASGTIASRSLSEDSRRVGGSQNLIARAPDSRDELITSDGTMLSAEAIMEDDLFCFDPIYRKRTLKLIKETPFIGLFNDLKGQTRFEASGISIAQGAAWVIFDNLRTVGKISLDFNFMGKENVLISEAGEPEAESQFEGLSYLPKTDTFLVVRETFVKKTPNTSYDDEPEHELLISQAEEVKVSRGKAGDTFSVIRKCTIEFEFEDVNKGFESMFAFDDDKGDRWVLGLCESNYCKTIQGVDPPGLDPGHGRMVLAKRVIETKGDEWCRFEVEKIIHVPRKAAFLDYSALAFLKAPAGTRPKGNYSVAITSQEDAAVWVGSFDFDAMEFSSKGKVFHFPRDEHCGKVYCNVEGVQWIDSQRLVLASDKSKATQPHSCMHKDQSVAIMALPKYN